MSNRFRHLRLVRPWLSVVRQYLGQPESLQLRQGSDRPSQLLGFNACPTAQEALKPLSFISAAVRDSRFDRVLLYEESISQLPTDVQGSRLYSTGRQTSSQRGAAPSTLLPKQLTTIIKQYQAEAVTGLKEGSQGRSWPCSISATKCSSCAASTGCKWTSSISARYSQL